MKLIDKDAIIAEIEKLKDEAKIHPSDFNCGRLSICKELMNFLNILEVKEMDLEEEDGFIDKTPEWICNNIMSNILESDNYETDR